jgi:hypothetical protein
MPELSAVVLSTDNEHRTILQIAVDHTGVGRVANSFNSYPVGTSDLILKSVLTLRPDVVIVDIVPNNPAPALHAIELLQAEIPTSAIIAIGETTKPQIIWDAIDGEGLNEQCVCEDTESIGPPIRTINGIPPYPDGNFRMVGSDCIEITPIDHGLQFADTCSAPCCTCDELEPIVRQIERFADGALTLQNFVSRLQGEVAAMNSTILGSTLTGQGCREF